MFGIGGTELLVLAAVALVVVGPKRLPEVMRLFGKGLAEFRRMASDVRTTVTAEMDRIDMQEKTKQAHEELFGEKKSTPSAQPSTEGELTAKTDEAAAQAKPETVQQESASQVADAHAVSADEKSGVHDEWTLEQAEKKAAAAAMGASVAAADTGAPVEPEAVGKVKAELDEAREACRKAEAETAATAKTGETTNPAAAATSGKTA